MPDVTFDLEDLDGLRRFAYDLEIAKSVEEVGGWNHKEEMGVAVCSLCDLDTGFVWHFDEKLMDALQYVMHNAVLRVSFNGRNFDMPVLRGCKVTDDVFHMDWDENRDYDIREEFAKAKGDDYAKGSLGKVCQATFGMGKTGAGAESPEWHKSGQFARNFTYCGHDAQLTALLFHFIDRYGYVIDPASGKKLNLLKFTGNEKNL